MWYKIPGWTPVLVNGELLQLVDTIFITEGPVDALLLTQEGIPAVSHTGGAGYWNDVWFTAFNRVKKIYYICDNDDAGRHAGKKVAQSLGYDRVLLYNFVDKKEKYDTGDFFKDGGTGKDFREMVEQGSKNYFEIGDMNGKQGFVRRGSKRKVERVYLGFSR
jgi:DNA primase